MKLVMGISDRIVLHHGSLLAEGSPDDIRHTTRCAGSISGRRR